jgi:hypothetical protein
VKHNTAVIDLSVRMRRLAPQEARPARRCDGHRTEAARVRRTSSRRRAAAAEDVLSAICPAAHARNRQRRPS